MNARVTIEGDDLVLRVSRNKLPMRKIARIIVTTSGGVVRNVFTDNPDDQVDVLDYDDFEIAPQHELAKFSNLEKELERLKQAW